MGITAPVKERRVLNDPKGLLGADFDRIPVSIIFGVIVRTAFFVLWAMQHRWIDTKRCYYGYQVLFPRSHRLVITINIQGHPVPSAGSLSRQLLLLAPESVV